MSRLAKASSGWLEQTSRGDKIELWRARGSSGGKDQALGGMGDRAKSRSGSYS